MAKLNGGGDPERYMVSEGLPAKSDQYPSVGMLQISLLGG